MATNNMTIMQKAFLSASNDYAQRVPDVTTAGIARVARTIFDPMNEDILNYFSSFLLNRIGGQRLNSKRWTSPIEFLKGDNMPFGSTFMETQLKWVKAHGLQMDDIKSETVLKTHFPEGLTAYHSVNRRDVYESSWNDEMLQTAFTSETGLVDFVSAVIDVLYNSDAYDTYQIYKELFATHHQNNGMYVKQVSNVTDQGTAQDLLVELRAHADLLKIPSTIYNAQSVTDLPCWVNPDELILFTEPYTNANLDVRGLAAAFNVDYARFKYKVVVLDSIPIPDVNAVLTVPEFFVIKDTVFTMREFNNPHSLTKSQFLHHHSVNSTSPFVPAVAFSTSSSTTIPVIEINVTGMTVEQPAQVIANDVDGGRFIVELEGTVTPEQYTDAVAPRPDSAFIQVVSVEGADGDIPFSPSDVFTNDYGVLRVNIDHNAELRQAVIDGNITVNLKATSTYINPSGETQEFTEDIAYKNIVLGLSDAESSDDSGD